MEETLKGTVTRLMTGKGYGFIKGDDGLSRFFNAADVQPARDFDLLREGRGVEFEDSGEDTGKGNGLRAKGVRIAV